MSAASWIVVSATLIALPPADASDYVARSEPFDSPLILSASKDEHLALRQAQGERNGLTTSGMSQTPAAGTSVIRGRIVAADTGRPLRHARITVSALESGVDNRSAGTDPDGRNMHADRPEGVENGAASIVVDGVNLEHVHHHRLLQRRRELG